MHGPRLGWWGWETRFKLLRSVISAHIDVFKGPQANPSFSLACARRFCTLRAQARIHPSHSLKCPLQDWFLLFGALIQWYAGPAHTSLKKLPDKIEGWLLKHQPLWNFYGLKLWKAEVINTQDSPCPHVTDALEVLGFWGMKWPGDGSFWASSHLCWPWQHVPVLRSATVRAFIPQKLATAITLATFQPTLLIIHVYGSKACGDNDMHVLIFPTELTSI